MRHTDAGWMIRFCSAGDDEVHRVLTEKVFLKQGFVMNSAEILPADTA